MHDENKVEEPRKLKRIVIKEELVELTGNYKKAIVLNQMLYWSERIKDFDKFIEEENKRRSEFKKSDMFSPDQDIELSHGWIYKSSDELSEETMMQLSRSNMRAILKYLVQQGYLSERTNPKYRWDKTKQYRVEIICIAEHLNRLGYTLDGYRGFKTDPVSKQNIERTKIEHRGFETEHRGFETEHQTSQNRTAIPEITTEITTDLLSTPSPKQKKPKNRVFMIPETIADSFTDAGNISFLNQPDAKIIPTLPDYLENDEKRDNLETDIDIFFQFARQAAVSQVLREKLNNISFILDKFDSEQYRKGCKLAAKRDGDKKLSYLRKVLEKAFTPKPYTRQRSLKNKNTTRAMRKPPGRQQGASGDV